MNPIEMATSVVLLQNCFQPTVARTRNETNVRIQSKFLRRKFCDGEIAKCDFMNLCARNKTKAHDNDSKRTVIMFEKKNCCRKLEVWR